MNGAKITTCVNVIQLFLCGRICSVRSVVPGSGTTCRDGKGKHETAQGYSGDTGR